MLITFSKILIIKMTEKIKEDQKTEKNLNNNNISSEINEDVSINQLISSIINNEKNKIELIEKLKPYFSIKVIPQRDIDIVYSSIEKINSKKIDLIKELKYEEKKFDSKNEFEINSKSFGLSELDLDLSSNIFNHKQYLEIKNNEEKLDLNSNKSSKIHSLYSIFISLFRIIIDYKDIKLSEQIYEELKEINNSYLTEKKILFGNFIEKYGLYIPLELIIGGKINIYYEVNNEEEIKKINNIVENEIKENIGLGILDNLNLSNNNINPNNFSESLNKKLKDNFSIKVIGGDNLYKDNIGKWIKSFNKDNLEIIEYKTLIPIYCFIKELKDKLKICFENYKDIILQEINNLIENKFKNEENNLFEGSSKNCNLWEIGITKDNYKSFIIYEKVISKKIIIDKNIEYNKKLKEDLIFGEIPEGFIICGWLIKINSNLQCNNIICSWRKKKELNIIGSICYKFKLNINIEEKNNLDDDLEIEWIIKIFCINCDYLIPYSSINNFNQNEEHYFLNCDCYKRIDKLEKDNNICYYKKVDKKDEILNE